MGTQYQLQISVLAMNFGKKLSTLRKKKGLTQKALAECVSVHITQIQRYENGSSQPTLDIIRKLAIAMMVSADQLVFDEASEFDVRLQMQFEAIKGFDEKQQDVASEIIDALILKYQR